jgi:channel protein (hemolysin III family)
MYRFEVHQVKKPLEGEVQISGAKNAVLAVMAAGPTLGWLVGAHPWHRSTMVLVIVSCIVTVWTVVLTWPGHAPTWVLVILVVVAMSHGGGIRLFAALVFAIPMVLAFLMSTLYHALQTERAKRVFKVLDNSSTYVLIAGAFTPYCLLTLAGHGGDILLAVEWLLAIVGIVIEAAWATRPRWVHGIIYGAMCAAFLAFMPTLAGLIEPAGFWLLCAAAGCAAGALTIIYRMWSAV